jgi:hypothetical protein
VATSTVALVGCATPEPVLRLTPLSESVVFNGGRAAQVKENRLVRVAAAFEREYARPNRRLVGFLVEIENTSDKPLLVDPAQFYYAACSDSLDRKTVQCQPSRRAVNPESILLALDIEHARKQAQASNEETFATTLMFLDLAAAATNAAAGNRHAAVVGLVGAGDAAAIATEVRADGHSAGATYENARATWAEWALRKTTLLPGRAASGLVFVDRVLGATKIVLAVRVAEEAVDLPFRQVQFDTRPDTRPRGKTTIPRMAP